MFSKNEILEIFRILEKEFVFDKTELDYFNQYQLLVAIMLSAQANDASVNKATKHFFTILKTPQDAIKLGVDKINNEIKTINYHNNKAKNIVKMSEQVISQFNNKIPNNFKDLVSLAGVGRKTANLFLSIVYDTNNIAVDTHVFRTTNRIGIVNASNVLQTEMQLIKNVPENKQKEINSLFIKFGRKYCKAIKPKCNNCPLKHLCKKYKLNNNK